MEGRPLLSCGICWEGRESQVPGTDCGCSLSDDSPLSTEQKTPLALQQNLEFENVEIDLLNFDEVPLLAKAQEKPVWVAREHPIQSQEVLDYSTFPIPPPLCS